ncbi:MAG TPA: 30S ribosomal protein S12 methylthiotransferase RimO [Desulfomonilia bacterium]
MTEAKKSFSIISLGCPKNLVDSEYICEKLSGAGFTMVNETGESDVVIVNTCAFLQSSVRESIDTMLEWLDRGKEVVCTGCIVSRYGKNLKREFPEIKVFAGPGTYDKLPRMIMEGDECAKPLFGSVTARTFTSTRGYAYVKISEGCSNHCSYCLIPSLRGELVSKPEALVIEECGNLIKKGARELILIGQDLGGYGKERGVKDALPGLVKKLSALDRDVWIRLMYIHPASLTRRLVETIMENPNVCRYVDIPVQHISGSVLEKMGRKGGKNAVERSLAMLDDAGIWIRSTLMVGHPGEDEKAFSELVGLVDSGIFGSMGAFVYSPEAGTESAAMTQIEETVKKGRLKKIMSMQKKVSRKRLKTLIGRTEKVLVEGFHPETGLLLKGRTQFQAPDVDGMTMINEGSAPFGDFAKVELIRSTDYDLIGRIV